MKTQGQVSDDSDVVNRRRGCTRLSDVLQVLRDLNLAWPGGASQHGIDHRLIKDPAFVISG